MPLEENFEFRVSFRKLLIGLLVSLIPISLAGLYTITLSERLLERTIGNHFKTIADLTAADISQYVSNRVVDVATIAVEPLVITAVENANRAYQGLNEAAIGVRIEKIEKEWTTPSADAIVKEILSSQASRLLRRRCELEPRLLRITVTDERGATVAATHKTLDYYQADEKYWQDIYAHGRGAVSLTDILYDQATNSYYIGIGMPLNEEGSNRMIGTVDALMDVTSLLPLVNRLQLGPTARILLAKEDGTVISGPHVTLEARMKSQEWAAVRDAMGALEGRQTGYLTASSRATGKNLIGFSDTGLKQHYPNLGWTVLVAQDTREALAPMKVVGRLVAFMSLLSLFLITFLVVYFALHRRVPITEIGDLAHETPLTVPATARTAPSGSKPPL